MITFEDKITSDALVTVKVYDTIGQEVATLAGEFTEGPDELDGSSLSSGIYLL